MHMFRPFERYMEFSGRSGRAEFWQWYAFTLVGSWLTQIVDSLRDGPYQEAWPLTQGAFGFAVLIPSIAVQVRRLHDIGESAKKLAANYIVFGVSLALIAFSYSIFRVTGQRTMILTVIMISGLIMMALALTYFLYLTYLCTKRGDDGRNAYGEPDIAPDGTNPIKSAVDNIASTLTQPKPVSMDSTLDMIERLSLLRQNGHISDAEFQDQKKSLLDRIK